MPKFTITYEVEMSNDANAVHTWARDALNVPGHCYTVRVMGQADQELADIKFAASIMAGIGALNPSLTMWEAASAAFDVVKGEPASRLANGQWLGNTMLDATPANAQALVDAYEHFKLEATRTLALYLHKLPA